MKRSVIACALCCLFPLGVGLPVFAASAPAPAAKKAPANALRFRVQQLHLDNNEGCAVADFDRDGHLDISAGEFWYAGPDFKVKRPLRSEEHTSELQSH